MSVSIRLPGAVRNIIAKLEKGGFEAYAVGGCVRDSLLGRTPKDWDIATSATPREVKRLFARTVDTGIAHGTVTVLFGRDGYEVTTYRIDGKYEDARHPCEVTFTPSLAEDLARRDFTINAMAYNEKDGLVDLYGGRDDMKRRLIRCVGDPALRFGEDALRMMRAVRFSAQLDYEIEEGTLAAIRPLSAALSKISAERVRDELVMLIVSPNPERLRLCYDCGITAVILPEFDAAMNTGQESRDRIGSVGEHSLRAMRFIDPDPVLRLVMLLHDIAKPVYGPDSGRAGEPFPGHAKEGAREAKKILRRLRFDNATVDLTCRLVACHQMDVRPVASEVRHAASRIGKEIFPLYLKVRRADILAESETDKGEKLEQLGEIEACFRDICARGDCLSLKDLALTGRDLIKMGIKPGPELGRILEALLDVVLDDPSRNRRDYLQSEARLMAGLPDPDDDAGISMEYRLPRSGTDGGK